MEAFSLLAFFEALFKYGKDYGLSAWHFMAFAVLGLFLWIGAKVTAGAGRAVQGAQNVYIKMIEDLQKKADADRADQEARVALLRDQLKDTRAELDDTSDRLMLAKRELARLRALMTHPTTPPHEGGTDGPATPHPG